MCHDIYVNSRVTPSLQECDLDIILKTTSVFSVWKQPCTWTPGNEKAMSDGMFINNNIVCLDQTPTGGQANSVLRQRNRPHSPCALAFPTPPAKMPAPAHRRSRDSCVTPEKSLPLTLRTPIPHPSRKAACTGPQVVRRILHYTREIAHCHPPHSHSPPLTQTCARPSRASPSPYQPLRFRPVIPTILASSHPLSPSTHSSCPLPPYYHPNSHINLPFTKDGFGEQKNGRTSNMLA